MKKQPIVLISENDIENDTQLNFGSNDKVKKTKMNAAAYELHLGTSSSSSPTSLPSPDKVRIPSPFERPKNHAIEINAVLKVAKNQNRPLSLPKDWLTPYIKNKHLLERFFKEGIKFEFADENEKYDQDDVKLICRFLGELQTQKKKATQKKKPTQGNPNLNSTDNIEFTNRKKAQRALFDANNVLARKQIFMLKDLGYTDSKIALELNNNGILTSRGKAFHPKQIARLLISYQELITYFNPHQFENRLLTVAKSGDLPELPISSIVVNDNIVKISFKVPINDPMEIRIIDNRDYPTFYERYEASNLKEITIDVLEKSSILPGKNYLFIRSLEHQEHICSLTIRPDFLLNSGNLPSFPQLNAAKNSETKVNELEILSKASDRVEKFALA